jgi:hypothetical protein
MMLERLSRETVFGYEESVFTATHSDAIACLPSDQVNGSPAVGCTVSQYVRNIAVADRAEFTDFKHKIERRHNLEM